MDKSMSEIVSSNEDEGQEFAALPGETSEPCVIVHGGIGAEYSMNLVFAEMVAACRISASLAYQKILSGDTAIDAVESALWWLENDEYFNCGYGSVVNNEGYVEMDACMINGTKRECGSVVAIRDVEHPISVARYTMEKFPNTIVAGDGAKRLAKSAGINWISRESMISPAAYFAGETKHAPIMGYFDERRNGSAEILKSNDAVNLITAECHGGSLGAVGCVAWDGSSIVAGTSSGGTRGKMLGRVGDSPLMGCGTFANRHSGCSLTGHGESIIKMGLARRIVEDISERSCEPQAVLKKNLEDMSSLLGHRAGGIVLRTDGSWGAHYLTTSRDPMPYAIVKNGLITYASQGGGQKTRNKASARNVLDTRLFSFREWQRYIECRRCILVNVHFPTKLKLEPDAPGGHHLYLKFIADIKSKSSDREEPEIKNYKHLIPRELADAMRTSIERLNDIAVSTPKEVEIFRASLTPQHSYLQQLLEDPEKDMATNIRMNFHSTKVGYMTNPKSLQTLAAQCDIDLEITDTGMHFIEKVVPPFEQSKLPSIQEFNKTVRVEKPAAMKSRRDTLNRETCEDTIEYLQRKNPGSMFVDSAKLATYDTARKSLRRRRRDFLSEYTDDFGFDEVLPNGKLLVGNNSDSDSESVHSVSNDDGNDSLTNGNSAELIDSFSKYNLSLSNYEKSILSGAATANLARSPRRKTTHNLLREPATGKFVSANTMTKLERAKNTSSRTQGQRMEVVNLAIVENGEEKEPEMVELDSDCDVAENREHEEPETIELESNCDFGLQDDDISILHDSSLNSSSREASGSHFLDPRSSNEVETLFRPYAEYWMYRCNFSRVKQKNFRQLENDLPQSFRWLLGECAGVVEMSKEDLYEEVCLVESYYADILRPSDCPSTQNQYNGKEYRTKSHYNSVKKKW